MHGQTFRTFEYSFFNDEIVFPSVLRCLRARGPVVYAIVFHFHIVTVAVEPRRRVRRIIRIRVKRN